MRSTSCGAALRAQHRPATAAQALMTHSLASSWEQLGDRRRLLEFILVRLPLLYSETKQLRRAAMFGSAFDGGESPG